MLSHVQLFVTPWTHQGSPPGSSVHRIFQARVLEWVAIFSSRGSSRPRDWNCVSCISCVGRRVLCHCVSWEAHNSVIFSYLLLPLHIKKKKSHIYSKIVTNPTYYFIFSLSLFNYLPLSMAIPSVQSLIYIISGHFFSSFSLRITGSSFLHTHPFTGSGSLFPVYLYSPEFYSHTLMSQKLKFLLCES